MSSKHLLITGKPGVGKTTLIRSIVSEIKDLQPSWIITGFWTYAIRDHGRRTGFEIKTLNGQQGSLARLLNSEVKSNFRVGKYSVIIDDLENIAVPILYKDTDLLIVDEIGKMELLSKKFQQAIIYAFNNHTKIIATIPIYENNFLSLIKKGSFIQQWELTRFNQKEILVQIISNICTK